MKRAIRFDPLEALYVRSESLKDRDSHGAGWSAHAAILDRLAANQRVAISLGWTSCAMSSTAPLERSTAKTRRFAPRQP